MSDSRKELETVLWAGADVLRSKMDANEYKDYLLSFIFYKYLSDTFLVKVYDLLEDCVPDSMEQAQKAYEEAYQEEDAADLLADLKESCRYVIEPHLTFTALAKKAANNEFKREELKKAFNDIETSDEIFNDLFADVDLYSSRLGVGDTKQSATVAELVKVIDKADVLHAEGDVLGNAYEYLIGEFASETGKKAGEFYTPAGPAEIVTRIAISGQEDKQGLLVYDPCMGSASMLLDARKFSTRPEYVKYFGQELMMSTYNLARMNMFLHGIAPENQHLRNGDTLDADWPTNEETEFDMVVMNPPYSANWSAKKGFLSDSRFSDYGALAPKSKADFAFLLHGFYHLKPTGTMAIVLPHGVLFRGASEGTIRQKLLEDGAIYAIIGLPANMFYNTDSSTCIIVLKKQRVGRDVLFIDASQLFDNRKVQNTMTAEHINHVIALYNARTNQNREAYLASFEEIKQNNYRLNIPMYVDTSEKNEPVRLSVLNQKISKIDDRMAEVQNALLQLLGEHTTNIPATQKEMEEFKKSFGQSRYALLKDVKKYYLQTMFPSDGRSVPEIRFKGFESDWIYRKLNEVSERLTRKNQNLESDLPLTISAQYGLIDQNEFFDKRIASRDVSGYYLLKKGEFAYNKSTSSESPWGAVKRLDRYEMGVLSPLYIAFRLVDEQKCCSDYVVAYYDTDLWHRGVQVIAAEGARNHGLLNISPTDFFDTKLIMPKDIQEQQKIGVFFKCLEELIMLNRKRIEER